MKRRAATGAGPVRTCVGCRQRDEQARLLRIVAKNGRLAPDPRRLLPGRGAYVHPDSHRGCVERAAHSGGLARALRVEVSHEDVAVLESAATEAAAEIGGEICKAEVLSR